MFMINSNTGPNDITPMLPSTLLSLSNPPMPASWVDSTALAALEQSPNNDETLLIRTP